MTETTQPSTTKILTPDETLECVEGDLSHDLRESHEAIRAALRLEQEARERADEKVTRLNKRIDELQKAKPAFLTDYRRMWDVVRHQRADLLDDGLITREEYTLLLAAEAESTNATGSPSPRRLESYDTLRAEVEALKQERGTLRLFAASTDEQLRFTQTEREQFRAERDAARQALASYGKHRPGCASRWRAATGSSQIGPCDCGLDAAITGNALPATLPADPRGET